MTCPLQIYYGQKNFQYIRKLPDIFVYFLIYKTQFLIKNAGILSADSRVFLFSIQCLFSSVISKIQTALFSHMVLF